MTVPVEPALEANEAAAATVKNKKTANSKNSISHQQHSTEEGEEATPKLVKVPSGTMPIQISASVPKKSNISAAEAKREFVLTLKQENQNFEVQAKDDGYVISGDDIILPSTAKGSNSNARYEIPENNLSRKAARILGSRKELEMHEFFVAHKRGQAFNADSGGNGEENAGADENISKIPIIDPSGDRQPSPNNE